MPKRNVRLLFNTSGYICSRPLLMSVTRDESWVRKQTSVVATWVSSQMWYASIHPAAQTGPLYLPVCFKFDQHVACCVGTLVFYTSTPITSYIRFFVTNVSNCRKWLVGNAFVCLLNGHMIGELSHIYFFHQPGSFKPASSLDAGWWA